LHRHLEGSLRLETLIELVNTHSLDLPKEPDALRALVQYQPREPRSQERFLAKFTALRAFFLSPETIQRHIHEVLADAAEENLRYLELSFTPAALCAACGFPVDESMDWVIQATRTAAEHHHVKTRLLASVNRHEGNELAEKVVAAAIERQGDGIVGLSLAGLESGHPNSQFIGLFREARQASLGISVHAGEWGPPTNIIEAIEQLGADRIGHGVRILEAPEVVALARERRVTFEVCPTSNYQSGVVEELSAHPLPQMMAAGLNVTVNTDDPSISQIELSDEYRLACETLGLELDQLRACVLHAAQAAFLPEGERQSLVAAIEKEWQGIAQAMAK